MILCQSRYGPDSRAPLPPSALEGAIQLAIDRRARLIEHKGVDKRGAGCDNLYFVL